MAVNDEALALATLWKQGEKQLVIDTCYNNPSLKMVVSNYISNDERVELEYLLDEEDMRLLSQCFMRAGRAI